jgi:hypothetical protein
VTGAAIIAVHMGITDGVVADIRERRTRLSHEPRHDGGAPGLLAPEVDDVVGREDIVHDFEAALREELVLRGHRPANTTRPARASARW